MVVLPTARHRSVGIQRNIVHLGTTKRFFWRPLLGQNSLASVFLCPSFNIVAAVSTRHLLVLKTGQGECLSVHGFARVCLCMYTHTCIYIYGYRVCSLAKLVTESPTVSPHCKLRVPCLLPSSCPQRHGSPVGVRSKWWSLPKNPTVSFTSHSSHFFLLCKRNQTKIFVGNNSLLLLLLFLFLFLVSVWIR